MSKPQLASRLAMIDFTSNPTIGNALEMYTDLGFDAIPLKPCDKSPLWKGWQTRPVNRLWRGVPDDVNIGLRGGGPAHVAFIDCDDKNSPGTFAAAQRWLARLGYMLDEYPIVSTASGVGKNIYIVFTDILAGSVRTLAPDFGAGEFRYGSGGYVVAPPSIVTSSNPYKLIAGDFRQLPHIQLKDILPILTKQDNEPSLNLKPSRKAISLLSGKGIDRYKSHSEADASLIASLINSGYSFEAILEVFENNPTSGKYGEITLTKGSKAALHYLRASFSEVMRWTQSHESKERTMAAVALDWAKSTPWKGRTGAIDRLVYIAHAEIAYQSGQLSYAAACRDIAERAGVSSMTASRSTHRLCNNGLLIREREAVYDCAATYRLAIDMPLHSPLTPGVRKCNTMSAHDAFRQSGLGKSAEHVWQTLQSRPARAGELAEITGRHIRTVERALDRMSKLIDPSTGELLSMVETDENDIWHILPVDIDQIAKILGTTGIADRQREEHLRERQAHHQSLLFGRKHKFDSSSASGDQERV